MDVAAIPWLKTSIKSGLTLMVMMGIFRHLLRENFELRGSEGVKVRKEVFNQHSLSKMFIGVVGNQRKKTTVIGIFSKRIAEDKQLERATYCN
jgi:hypothetical protein